MEDIRDSYYRIRQAIILVAKKLTGRKKINSNAQLE